MKNLALTIMAAAAFACTSAKATTDLSQGLPLPDVPTELRQPVDRANYVVKHYWDAMDFSNRKYALDDIFMEQAFANYAQVLPIANVDSAYAAVADLLQKASADSDVRAKVIDIATLYLYEPDSPVYNEDMFALFAKAIIANPDQADVAQLSRAQYQLETIQMNMVGSAPSDFEFIDRSGAKHSLHEAMKSTTTLLIFYDPDCDDCHKVMSILSSEQDVNSRIAKGNLRIIAIADAETKDRWQALPLACPQGWTDGIDITGINDAGLYEVRHTPTLYLISPEGQVLLKDAPLGKILDTLTN